jgi:RNA polymerase sigma-70 factor (ECF subfamily)
VRNNARHVLVEEEQEKALQDEAALARYAQDMEAGEIRIALDRLSTCLNQLQAERRTCIVLAYVDGCSHGEIAQRTHKPLGTVKAWIQRGMRTLRECMA